MLMSLLLLAGAQGAEPPADKEPARVCKCAEAPPADAVVFEGVPFDAQITLDASGLKAEPRQATLFRVSQRVQGDIADPAKLWHVGDTKACGVRFDYGKRYRVRARRVGDNLETDFCLMKDVAQPPAQ